MGASHVLRLPACRETLQPILAECFQHAKAGLAVYRHRRLEQALVHERRHPIEHLLLAGSAHTGGHVIHGVAHRRHGSERAAPNKHRQPSEQPLRTGVEQSIAPGDSPPEGLLTVGQVPRPPPNSASRCSSRARRA